jgi:hypothetical protein
MTCSIVVDPSALWLLDGSEANEEEASDYVTAAVMWISGALRAGCSLAVSDRAVQRLADAGVFPAEAHIRSVLERAGLAHVVSAKQLATSISKFLSTAPRIEDEWEISDVLTDAEIIEPDLFSSIANHDLRLISLLNACLICAHSTAGCGGGRYVLYGYPRLKTPVETAEVRYTLVEVVSDGVAVTIPLTGVETVRFVKAPTEISAALDAEKVWASATSVVDLELAISLAASRLAKQADRKDIKAFRVGSAFLDSLRRHGAHGVGGYGRTTLNRCAQVVAASDNLDVHDFREKAAPTSSARRRARDNARARRTHVTAKHEALRLMFWDLACGAVEFANVGNKFGLHIEDGDPLPQD